MQSFTDRINQLDISLFEHIHSQTSIDDKEALLIVQRALRRQLKPYIYLEIGSHLGGSIQPYLCDDFCKTIYSIDPRPMQQPDDRAPGYIATYTENSTQRMLELLSQVDPGRIGKIITFESDARDINPASIQPLADLAFIDGEHTNKAVLSDFGFCNSVLKTDGILLFHDYWIIKYALKRIQIKLTRQKRTFIAIRVKGNVFGIFFNKAVVMADPALKEQYELQQMYAHRAGLWLEYIRESFRINVYNPTLLAMIKVYRTFIPKKSRL
jgi:hypothetical protein